MRLVTVLSISLLALATPATAQTEPQSYTVLETTPEFDLSIHATKRLSNQELGTMVDRVKTIKTRCDMQLTRQGLAVANDYEGHVSSIALAAEEYCFTAAAAEQLGISVYAVDRHIDGSLSLEVAFPQEGQPGK